MTLPAGRPIDEYKTRLAARLAELGRQRRTHVWLGNCRIVGFLGLLALAAAAFFRDAFSPWWLVVPVAMLAAAGIVMERREAVIDQLLRATRFYERALDRLADRWAGRGVTGERFRDEHHLYAADLDILGEASLYERLCLARTERGEALLANWLLHAATPGEVAERQVAVRELVTKPDLREEVALAGAFGTAQKSESSAAGLASWGSEPVRPLSPLLRVLGWTLSFTGLLAIAAAIAYVGVVVGSVRLPEPQALAIGRFALVAAAICVAGDRSFKRRSEAIISRVFKAEQQLSLLAGIMKAIEEETFEAPRLSRIRHALVEGDRKASRQIAKLRWLAALLQWRTNEIVRLAGPLVQWDLHVSMAIESWRNISGRSVGGWLEAVGEMEALASIAWYTYERRDDVFPQFVEDAPMFDAAALRHPLLPADRVITNDLRLASDMRVCVVSGSNMSGKSTLLRAIGVNAVLAQAGAPVAATSLRMSPLKVGASIRVQDSLRDGTSRFYAEISRLSAIMQTAAEGPLIFLIDEFLHGTNSHDRKIGAEAVVRGLVERGAVGLITTHDLALTDIATALAPRAANMHFQDFLEQDKMRFDYRLRPGIVEHSNALELMRSVGLDV